jgi:hypothetical protein
VCTIQAKSKYYFLDLVLQQTTEELEEDRFNFKGPFLDDEILERVSYLCQICASVLASR